MNNNHLTAKKNVPGGSIEPAAVEYAVRAETKAGTVLTLRAGFASRDDAEDHPVRMSSWKRVWVEEIAAKRKPADTLPPLPWDWIISGVPSANGMYHAYLVDATGRKIAAIWGRGNEKRLVAEAILRGVNPLSLTEG